MKLLRNLTLALLGISIQLAPLHSGAMELTKQDQETINQFFKTYKGQKRNVLYTSYKKPFCGGYAMGVQMKDTYLELKGEIELAKKLRDKLRTITKSNSSKLFNKMTQETYNSHMNRIHQLLFSFSPTITFFNNEFTELLRKAPSFTEGMKAILSQIILDKSYLVKYDD